MQPPAHEGNDRYGTADNRSGTAAIERRQLATQVGFQREALRRPRPERELVAFGHVPFRLGGTDFADEVNVAYLHGEVSVVDPEQLDLEI